MSGGAGRASSTFLGARTRGAELLDQEGHDSGELARSLELVDRVNRWFGGRRALRRHLEELEVARGRRLRVLDVGCGAGHALLALRERWPGPGRPGLLVGVDRHPEITALAEENVGPVGQVVVVQGDALRLPFATDAFDLVICTLTLHHFFGGDAVRALREMARVACVAIVVNDLERHVLNYWAARLLAVTLWRASPVTRHDGPLSVRRAFTRSELRRLGEEAGLADVRVRRHFPFRLVLEGRP